MVVLVSTNFIFAVLSQLDEVLDINFQESLPKIEVLDSTESKHQNNINVFM